MECTVYSPQSSVLGQHGTDLEVAASPTRTIAIVLDLEFGTRVASLAERVAVWIVDSDANRPAIEALWNARRTRQVTCDVTIFRPIPGLSTGDHLDGVLRSIDTEADAEEERPELEWIEVYGLEVDESIESLLRARGFGGSAPLRDGFRARMRRER